MRNFILKTIDPGFYTQKIDVQFFFQIYRLTIYLPTDSLFCEYTV